MRQVIFRVQRITILFMALASLSFFGTGCSAIGGIISAIIPAIGNILSKVAPVVSDLAQKGADLVKTGMDKVGEFGQKLTEGGGDLLKKGVDGAKELVDKGVDVAKDGAKALVETTEKAAKTALAPAKEEGGSWFDGILNTGKDLLDKGKDMYNKYVDPLVNPVTQTKKLIETFTGDKKGSGDTTSKTVTHKTAPEKSGGAAKTEVTGKGDANRVVTDTKVKKQETGYAGGRDSASVTGDDRGLVEKGLALAGRGVDKSVQFASDVTGAAIDTTGAILNKTVDVTKDTLHFAKDAIFSPVQTTKKVFSAVGDGISSVWNAISDKRLKKNILFIKTTDISVWKTVGCFK
ncbi:hypothetical protein ACFL35_05615 [Candidatus Riflebacteria bacterium]